MFCPVCRSDYPDDWKVCPTDTTNLLRSPQIGKYAIEGLLGVGGMGAVFRATNPDTGGRVAIKIMNPEVASAEAARLRFQREAAAIVALRTAHVVTVFDFGAEPDGTLYLVMELLEGHTLRDEIAPGPNYMPLARVQLVVDGALKGLAAAHKAGIVHRDLKPENVFVARTDDGEVPKLLDFGIARVRTKDSDLTRTGSLMGTAAYMAIEQIAAGSGEIGPWSDVYAMGAILYELLSGEPAFGGTTVTDVLQKVLRAELTPLAELRPGLPDPVYALVARCMDGEPQRRPQDADAMRVALTASRLVAPGTPVPPASTTPPSASQVGLLATEERVAADGPGSTPEARRPAPAAPATPTTTKPTIAPHARRPRWPLISGGLVVAIVGGVLVVRSLGHAPVARPDAAVVAIAIDAAPTAPPPVEAPLDATVAIDAAGPPGTEDMVKIAAGSYDVGEPGTPHPDALAASTHTIGELWIDRTEVTLAQLRRALRRPRLGGKPGDTPMMPARLVTYPEADAACRALGKRLPTELEWEIAARTTPRDPTTATLLTGPRALVVSPRTECSAAGLCDMLGSLVEWTTTPWPGRSRTRVARGASLGVAPGAGWAATIHARLAVPESTADPEVGFRCVIAP